MWLFNPNLEVCVCVGGGGGGGGQTAAPPPLVGFPLITQKR